MTALSGTNAAHAVLVAMFARAGARPVVVEHSEADLNAIRAELDSLAGKASGDGRSKQARRPCPGWPAGASTRRHCTGTGQANFGQGGFYLGPTPESWFPGYDDALVRNDNPGYWIQGSWVDVNPSGGGFINVSGPRYGVTTW